MPNIVEPKDDRTCDEYDDNLPKWVRARDVMEGGDAIKKAKTRYVPKLDSQTDPEYVAYITRGSFFNASARTLDGLVGMIYRKPPTIKRPEGTAGLGKVFDDFARDCDMRGSSLEKYSAKIVTEVMSVGRAITLVDWSDEESRAYFCRYETEDVIYWETSRLGGRTRLSRVVIKEEAPALPSVEPAPATTKSKTKGPRNAAVPMSLRGTPGKTYGDGQSVGGSSPDSDYGGDTVEQLRILTLEPINPDRVQDGFQYRVVVKQKIAEKNTFVVVRDVIPQRKGRPIPSIPIIFHGPKNSEPDCDKLPLDDLIQVNLDHFRLDVDYKHGIHFTALPTAWVAGFPKETILRIGSATAWTSDQVGASAGFLEFTGQGLNSFVEALNRDESQMALLGARLIEPQKRQVETAEAMSIRQSGDASALLNVSQSVSESMTMLLKWVYWWNSAEVLPENISSDVLSFELNKDFLSVRMQADELLAMVKGWQTGAFSQETLLHNLRQGEILPPGVDDETEMERIQAGHLPPIATEQLPPKAPPAGKPGALGAPGAPQPKPQPGKPGKGTAK